MLLVVAKLKKTGGGAGQRGVRRELCDVVDVVIPSHSCHSNKDRRVNVPVVRWTLMVFFEIYDIKRDLMLRWYMYVPVHQNLSRLQHSAPLVLNKLAEVVCVLCVPLPIGEPSSVRCVPAKKRIR